MGIGNASPLWTIIKINIFTVQIQTNPTYLQSNIIHQTFKL